MNSDTSERVDNFVHDLIVVLVLPLIVFACVGMFFYPIALNAYGDVPGPLHDVIRTRVIWITSFVNLFVTLIIAGNAIGLIWNLETNKGIDQKTLRVTRKFCFVLWWSDYLTDFFLAPMRLLVPKKTQAPIPQKTPVKRLRRKLRLQVILLGRDLKRAYHAYQKQRISIKKHVHRKRRTPAKKRPAVSTPVSTPLSMPVSVPKQMAVPIASPAAVINWATVPAWQAAPADIEPEDDFREDRIEEFPLKPARASNEESSAEEIDDFDLDLQTDSLVAAAATCAHIRTQQLVALEALIAARAA